MKRPALLVAVVLCGIAGGCTTEVPEPETRAAQLYVSRCNGCHRVFAPGSLTAAMWDMQVERMQREMVRRGLPPLTQEERELVLTYLHRHSSDAQSAERNP